MARHFTLSLLVLGLSATTAFSAVATQAAEKDSIAFGDLLVRGLQQAPTQASEAGQTLALSQSEALKHVYAKAGHAALWTDANGWRPHAHALLRYLGGLTAHGINRDLYHYERLQNLLRAPAAEHRVEAEFRLSDAFIRLYREFGQSDASQTKTDIPSPTQFLKPAQALDALLPLHPQYWALSRALVEQLQQSQDAGVEALHLPRILREGDEAPQIQILANKLRASGDYLGPDTRHFSAELSHALKAFQKKRGLGVDGTLGPMTAAELNANQDSRIQQLISNLERWRSAPRQFGDSHIAVNIAAQELRYVHEGELVTQMKVIVGKPSRPTPVTSSAVAEVVLNPDWTVPYRIAVKDKLPLIQKDPGYIDRHGFTVREGWHPDAAQVDPSSIDWAQLNADNFPYVLRQKPGANNALGVVKFLFPNPYSVYLHDTPNHQLFQRNLRLFSSGCVRLSEPMELAGYLLRHHGKSTDTIELGSADARTQSHILASPVPVHLQYWTSWVDEEGELAFLPDIYGKDAASMRQRGESGQLLSANELLARLDSGSTTLLAQASTVQP